MEGEQTEECVWAHPPDACCQAGVGPLAHHLPGLAWQEQICPHLLARCCLSLAVPKEEEEERLEANVLLDQAGGGAGSPPLPANTDVSCSSKLSDGSVVQLASSRNSRA